MNLELAATVVVASLIGSLHCVGMCGGFVAFYSAGAAASGMQRALPHLAYHFGRWVTYCTWGLLAGSLGALVNVAGHAVGIGRVAAAIAGFVMVAWGIGILASRFGVSLIRLKQRQGWGSWVRRPLARLVERPPIVRALLLGLSSTLLPCGFLYAFVVTAAGTGSAFGGALVMTAFWFGTVPLLMALGLGIEQIGVRLRRHVPVITAIAMVGLGAYTVIGRVNVAAMAAQHLQTGLLHGSAQRADCPCHRR